MSSQIRWENVSDAEVRADSESAIENSGEIKKIRQFLNQNNAVEEWRKEVREICRKLINEYNIDNITTDFLFDYFSAISKDTLPPQVVQEVTGKIKNYLNSQFEDHS